MKINNPKISHCEDKDLLTAYYENELEEIGYNNSKNHVDMMIGTKDLNITAKTFDNNEIQIFKDGSFNI